MLLEDLLRRRAVEHRVDLLLVLEQERQVPDLHFLDAGRQRRQRADVELLRAGLHRLQLLLVAAEHRAVVRLHLDVALGVGVRQLGELVHRRGLRVAVRHRVADLGLDLGQCAVDTRASDAMAASVSRRSVKRVREVVRFIVVSPSGCEWGARRANCLPARLGLSRASAGCRHAAGSASRSSRCCRRGTWRPRARRGRRRGPACRWRRRSRCGTRAGRGRRRAARRAGPCSSWMTKFGGSVPDHSCTPKLRAARSMWMLAAWRQRRHVARAVPGRAHAELLGEDLQLARRRDAADLAQVHADEVDQPLGDQRAPLEGVVEQLALRQRRASSWRAAGAATRRLRARSRPRGRTARSAPAAAAKRIASTGFSRSCTSWHSSTSKPTLAADARRTA